jgi:hypothetical protein
MLIIIINPVPLIPEVGVGATGRVDLQVRAVLEKLLLDI